MTSMLIQLQLHRFMSSMLVCATLACHGLSYAQDAVLTPVPAAAPAAAPASGGTITLVGPDGQKIMVPAGTPIPDGFKPEGAPESKPADPNAKPEEKKGDKPADASPEVIKRKAEPPEPPNKREFDIKPDDTGMVEFQFRNQSWPDLLRWLAENSKMSLDWQELPGDYLNIATQRKHTLDETRDMFNRHLLARGFTMLEFDGTIQVVKTAGINAALVPKVHPRELESLPKNRFVRVSLPLRSLIASEVLTELKALISSNGSLNALASTNRLEAMDTASNLAELYRVLQEEQSESAVNNLAREFVLDYVRASEVRTQLAVFLGLENPKAGADPANDMAMQMQQQQQMMMMQQQMAQQGQAVPPGASKADEVHIVANNRRNSIIAHARPNKMAIIAAFIQRVDVEGENTQGVENKVKVYRLASLDPKQLVASLLAMDVLEPTTRFEVDEKNNAITVFAELYDHMVIDKTIKKLDGSARDVHVFQIRRRRAEDIAGTIKGLMGVEEKKEDNSRRRNYFFFDPFGNNDDKKKSNDTFRVSANAQDNQVLIWANEIELARVKNFLMKLGELPPEGGNRNRVRVIDANRSSETKEYLKRLQEAWGRMSPNPLVLPDDSDFEPPNAKRIPGQANDLDQGDQDKSDKQKQEPNKGAPADDKSVTQKRFHSGVKINSTVGAIPSGILSALIVNTEVDPPSTSENSKASDVGSNDKDRDTRAANESNAKASKPAIKMSFDERGNLVLASDDVDALNQLEQLMLDNAPPSRNYEVFYIKHARPSWIKWNLEDYYKEEKKNGKSDQDAVYRWLFDMEPEKKESDDPQLGKRRKLRFQSDNDTNTLLVIGADDVQLGTIEELIRLWDVPEKKKGKNELQYTKLVQVEYSKADSIVEAIKEAFRDLLSSNDKAFEAENAGTSGGSEGTGTKDTKRTQSNDAVTDGAMNFSFKGYLSLGVERITNSIIITAKGEDLLELVADLVTQLDETAKPTGSVEVIKLGGTNSKAMEKALRALMKNPPQDNGQPNQPNVNDVRINGNGNQGQPQNQPELQINPRNQKRNE